MAVVLNGTDQGIDLGTPAELDIRSRPIAFCATFRTTTASGYPFVFNHGRAPGAYEYRITFNVGVLEVVWAHIGGMHTQPQPPMALNDGVTHRVLHYVESSGAGDTVTWVDGVEVTREDNVDSIDGATTVDLNDISSIGYNSADGTFWFPGELADVAVWDTEPTTADAAALTAGTLSPADRPTGLRGYWPLDYDARDLGPHSLHGTPVGSPTFTETESSQTLPLGIAAETDLARPVATTTETRPLGTAAETDTAQAVIDLTGWPPIAGAPRPG